VPDEQATQRLVEVLGQIKKLPSANLEPPQFFANYLQLSVAATGSRGGAIWLTQSEQPPQCYCHMELELCGLNESEEQKRLVVEAVQRTVTEIKPLVVPPGQGGAAVASEVTTEGQLQNHCPYPLFFYPLRAANQVAMVLHYIGSDMLSPEDYRGVVGLLTQIAEAGESYLAHRRAAVLEDDRKALAKLLQYSETVHSTLDAEKVIYQVANLGREAIGCTRAVVWVDPLIKRGLRAVSGVDKPDRRAVLMQALEKLSKHCLRIKKPIVASREQLVELPEEEELTHLLKHYFNVSQLDQIFLQPIQKEDRYLGVMIAEGFDEATGTNLAGIIASVAKHGALALANALEMSSSWVRPLSRLQKAKQDPKKRRKWAIALAVILIGLVAGAFVPWTIKIDSNCKLTPRDRRIINVPLDGMKIAYFARSSGVVPQGETIAKLDDADLKAELATLQWDRIKQKAIYDDSIGTSREKIEGYELERYDQQIKLVQLHIDKCDMRAPITGTILTPELERLEGKPVQRGDLVCELADLAHWELILEVPQEEIGWVQRGLDEGGTVSVEFFLQAYPEERLSAIVSDPNQIGQMARITEEGNVFEVRVMVPEETLKPILEGLRDGSIGAAKIATVERPLGYVLLRKVIRFFRVTFF
jgi:HlyD family secretion protein